MSIRGFFVLCPLVAVIAILTVVGADSHSARVEAPAGDLATGPLITSVYDAQHAEGLMVTTGGWAYCEQMRSIARRTRYTLVCGTYEKDQYLGPGLRSRRQLDWGNPRYLARFAEEIDALHRRVGKRLILIGVSYSGFGVATLGSHHPAIHPDRLIVIDAYLDLVARRKQLPDSHETAREIDKETGGSKAALERRSVSLDGLARLVRSGTRLTVVWSVSEDERRFFDGATCNRQASAETLSRLARRLERPIRAWVTQARHGHDLWHNGVRIVRGVTPGREVVFRPNGVIPDDAVCREPR